MTLPPNDRTSLGRRSALYALWAAIGLLSACVHASVCPKGGARWQRSELFMGQLRRDHTPVDEPTFQRFVDEVVTPALPNGFTLLATQGQYRAASGKVVREPGHLLVVLHHGDPETESALESVRSVYREKFAQESVLRTDVATCASF